MIYIKFNMLYYFYELHLSKFIIKNYIKINIIVLKLINWILIINKIELNWI